jgi:hypothetical protein
MRSLDFSIDLLFLPAGYDIALAYDQIFIPVRQLIAGLLMFETSLFVAAYDSQSYGGGIRTRLHTG